MAAADVRDMLDLPADGQPRPHKKQKVVEKRPEGITRELYALLGEKAPPISLTENKYKLKKSNRRAAPWRMTEFTNEARRDGLVLRHWQRRTDTNKTLKPLDDTAMDVDEHATDGAQQSTQPYMFAKYNVKAQVPKRYTDDQYQRHLQSDDWSREETDYLMNLVEEYDLRWVIIADRYDFQPEISENTEANATALVTAKSVRTMEQMKARYYTVAANMLALEHPPSEMSEAEFALHEKMMKFDPERERVRKELAALQLNRTADEVREEGILLEELKRIVTNEQNFIAERRELYARLDVPYHVSNTTMYQSSQGLSQLLSTLLQADKSKKRRSILGPDGVPSPAGQTPSQTLPSGARDGQIDTPTAGPSNKRGSAAAASAAATPSQPTVRTLTKEEEQKYGVQHHDRVPPGVHFRNDKATKLTQAKSNIQTQKLAAALTELDIPLRLLMPTEKVCKEFEKLIHQVNTLLDARKVAEKVDSEIRVLEAAREERLRKEREANPNAANTSATNGGSTEQAEKQIKLEAVDDQPRNQEEGAPIEQRKDGTNNTTETAPETKGSLSHKRSASVLSAQSDKSSKRQRK
ncbi:DNA methyltransferase 1-associated protein DMAP1 [Talaromyces stipitatus ATCC 10500]|uniref:SWR1-complex protein 4 n=1 Tax=Talaromyces stipitatus (strain ATCC 10500 / CBS 375.48 / QM 6759 / NRRL 1006) TaxID=441959 RepID=B8LTX8_TALSN|nr:DNA methyltransferase 1-associated protein DMAP1 [Talaromyces stipitatus ATCC 10500]EED23808.1 DNA methyltransferase 1-associated protein DMAP1 [Talaromyces stipitatus ATCC 10500]